MRPIRTVTISLFCLAAAAGAARAHSGAEPRQSAPPPAFKLEKLTDRTWALFGQGGNVGFLVTDEGVVVVDDQYDRVAQGILDQIRTVTDRPIRYLINTHYHDDHTGGNRLFAKRAEIVAHDRVRRRMLEYPKVVRETFPEKLRSAEAEAAKLPEGDPWRAALAADIGLLKFFLAGANAFDPATAAPPRVTYQSEMRIWLGGEQVWIAHAGPGHTDGDSIVYFANQKVLHMGDLLFNGMYPFIDTAGGGSVQGYIESIDHVLEYVPADARVIPGHGPVTDIAGLKRARSFLADLLTEVEKAARSGSSLPDAVRSIKMESYPDIKPAFRTLGNVVAAAWDEVGEGR